VKLVTRQHTVLRPTLSLVETIIMIVGLVIGAGIFETPSFVAANAGNQEIALLAWLFGGLISLIGALCYAELATTYPHPGGSYYYLKCSFGNLLAFLFAWTRMSVIQTGSIALLAFVFGDYASQLLRLGSYSSSIYAISAIVLFTGLNLLDIRQSKWTQNTLATAQIIGILIVSIIGLTFPFLSDSVSENSIIYANSQLTAVAQSSSSTPPANIGLMMVFVLLTYGGWNEASYISAEVKNGQRNIVRSLVWSIGIITGLYLLLNWALVRGLGIARMASSEVVVADLMRSALGESGAVAISCLVIIATMCSINATILTGARSNYALGRDFSLFSMLMQGRDNSPTNALIVQGIITFFLILIGTFTRQGFETMVDYTAPAFWFFFLLSGMSLFILRWRDPNISRPFKVPFYPVTPLLFCGICLYMLQASLAYTGYGGLLGVIVVLLGLPLLLWSQKISNAA
jgi:basic amino acid/polyamine antiporter, APA family